MRAMSSGVLTLKNNTKVSKLMPIKMAKPYANLRVKNLSITDPFEIVLSLERLAVIDVCAMRSMRAMPPPTT